MNFLLGSATGVVVVVGGEAKNDAWLAIVIGGCLGIGLISFYHFFVIRFSEKNIFQIIQYFLGRKPYF
ncbi:GerAB/ArcD/ProY family transporter [Neobacillus niacini]|uniref:GerAB/ArcD/ProY family transporter n=1 Tax=Neobacillus niacini TaxID=86668 RepID=UPI003B587D13